VCSEIGLVVMSSDLHDDLVFKLLQHLEVLKLVGVLGPVIPPVLRCLVYMGDQNKLVVFVRLRELLLKPLQLLLFKVRVNAHVL
jgi:hypothetical protein